MARTLLSVLPLVSLVAGCAGPQQAPAAPARSPSPVARPAPDRLDNPATTPDAEASRAGRQPGEFVVVRVSGAHVGATYVLTERVIGVWGQIEVVDVTLEGEGVHERLRVRFQAGTGRAVAVSRFVGPDELPAAVADYERLLERTQLAPDSNDELVRTTTETCLVGDRELECEATTYAVTVGGERATMTVSRSAAVAGRDVAGEIRAGDGRVLYRAEVLEQGGSPASPGSSIALAK